MDDYKKFSIRATENTLKDVEGFARDNDISRNAAIGGVFKLGLLCDYSRNVSPDIRRSGCEKPPLPAAAKLTHYTIPVDAAEKIAAMLGALEEDGLGGD